MHVGDVSTVSSLSEDWVDAMRKSGVMGTAWSKTITVPLVRFDTLIERHGEPDFCKIDVEGFEPQVLSGLSRPVRCMSLEYQTQFHVSLGQCLERLRSLGEYRFQFSEGESMRLGFEDWMDEQELTARIETMRDAGGPEFFGDVYARFAD
ncbi:MAG: FkbM family methyltransferase, partial [Planctomycetota bacterium]